MSLTWYEGCAKILRKRICKIMIANKMQLGFVVEKVIVNYVVSIEKAAKTFCAIESVLHVEKIFP